MKSYIFAPDESALDRVCDLFYWGGLLSDGRTLLVSDSLDAAKYVARDLGASVAVIEAIPDYPPSWPTGLKTKRPGRYAAIVQLPGWTPDAGGLLPIVAEGELVCGISWVRFVETDQPMLLVGFSSDEFASEVVAAGNRVRMRHPEAIVSDVLRQVDAQELVPA